MSLSNPQGHHHYNKTLANFKSLLSSAINRKAEELRQSKSNGYEISNKWQTEALAELKPLSELGPILDWARKYKITAAAAIIFLARANDSSFSSEYVGQINIEWKTLHGEIKEVSK